MIGARREIAWLCLAAMLVAWAPRLAAADLFVDAVAGDDANDGLTWVTARATLASALALAAATPATDTVSVAAGLYAERVVVPGGTAILGGFPSGGGVRDPALHVVVIDGGGLGAPVVHFPPGGDGSALDGVTVRGGFLEGVTVGGGIFVEDAAVVVSHCVVEDNEACFGAGIGVVVTAPRPGLRIESCLVQRNTPARLSRGECARGTWGRGGGLYVSGPSGADLGTIVSDVRFIDNALRGFGAVHVAADAGLEHLTITGPSSALYLGGGRIRVFNALITGQISGVSIVGDGERHLESVTIASNDVGLTTYSTVPGDVVLRHSILWNTSSEIVRDPAAAPPTVIDSIVRGGYPGTGVIDSDPLFVPGPLGRHYLAQPASGHAVASPGFDAAPVTSASVGLDTRTTSSSSDPDGGALDFGYHAVGASGLAIRRGTSPTALSLHRLVAGLPFTDDPGTLSDPALPLLFYDLSGSATAIGAEADRATGAVRIVFR